MDFNFYNNKIDIAIRELIDLKIEISHVERGIRPPKCNPVIVNPSTGNDCLTSIDLRAGRDPGELEGAFVNWIEELCTRLTTRPEPTV